MNKDRLFTNENFDNKSFSFNDDVAKVFDDMIVRSVPMIESVHYLILDFCAKYFTNTSVKILDLGCSTGAFLKMLYSHRFKKNCTHYTGLDQSRQMINQLNKFAPSVEGIKVSTLCDSLMNVKNLPNNDIVILNLVLQFIPLKFRGNILKHVYNCLPKNGIVVIVEKIKHNDSHIHDSFKQVYYDFKRKNRYSDEEIYNKEKALKNVLVPLTILDNKNMIKESGFSYVTTFFQWMNFVGFIAKK